MKHIFLIAIALMVVTLSPVKADETEQLAAKLRLAKQYTKLIPVADEVKATIDALAIQIPMDKRVIFRSVLERTIDVEQLESVSEMAMAEVFTVDELEALIAFYSTPEGLATRQKMPEYQSRISPVLEKMVTEAVETFQKQAK